MNNVAGSGRSEHDELKWYTCARFLCISHRARAKAEKKKREKKKLSHPAVVISNHKLPVQYVSTIAKIFS